MRLPRQKPERLAMGARARPSPAPGLSHPREIISFSYTAKSDFQGQDEFTVQVSGTMVRIAGVSDVKVKVLVVDQ
jgi:hypothetical protein